MIIKILGSGTSSGIPVPACDCSVCASNDIKDTRLRTSIVIEINNKTILIDTSPDFRTQALNNKIKKIDFVISTHDHADHLHGIDDLRSFCFPSKYNGMSFKRIPLYSNEYTIKSILNRFNYIFNPPPNYLGGGLPLIDLNKLEIEKNSVTKIIIEELQFNFFTLPHGNGQTIGFCLNSFAYLVDCHTIPKNIIEYLNSKNLELVILDCVQKKHHASHLTFDKALEYANLINARSSGFIHFNHDLSHKEMTDYFDQENLSYFATFDGQLIKL